MKEDEVPQDDENLLEGRTRELQYAVDNEGNYKAVKSVGWEPKNSALKEAWKEINEEMEKARVQVNRGIKSPLYFHMKKHIMTPRLLAKYAGLNWFRVRRHLRPKGYAGLTEEETECYRYAFSTDGKYDLNELQ